MPGSRFLRRSQEGQTDSGGVLLDTLLARLPPEWPEDLLPAIARTVRERHERIVVLDDDPTGTQTVHMARVLLRLTPEALRRELEADERLVFLLTNSRSLPARAAERLARRLGRSLAEARREDRPAVVISRSDSTLRGHFPDEVDALVGGLAERPDATVLVPALIEGGRVTVDDVHYVVDRGAATPVGETAYARDPVFGYRSSNLRDWIEEKTGGRIAARDVVSVSLNDIRLGGPDRVVEVLRSVVNGGVCVVNAASDRDLEVVVAALLEAEAQGRRFMYRTAASFVRLRAGLARRPLLTRADLGVVGGNGGLIVVGSYVPRSSEQLEQVLTLPAIESLEVDVRAFLSGDAARVVRRTVERAEVALRDGSDVAIFTSRAFVTREPEAALAGGRRIAYGLARIVGAVRVRPRFVVAKGGITSSVVARRGLRAASARVLGQILPGVPVWQLDSEARHPGLVYVVFPGNVGSGSALRDMVVTLRGATATSATR